MQSILKNCNIVRVSNSASAAQTAIDSSVLDMAGYDSVIFVALLGDVTTGSVLTLTPKENTANSTSSPAPTAVTGAATATFTAGATDADNKLLVSDVFRPAKRYVFANLTRTTANAVVDGIIAIQYNSRAVPVTPDASVLASVFVAAQ